MSSHLSPWAAVVMVLVAVGLIWINRNRDARSILHDRFGASGPPDGLPIECEVRFPLAGGPTPCVAHASEVGLYLVTPPEVLRTWRWVNNIPFLKRPVFIPWSQLEYRCASFPARRWLRFDIRNTKATFFVRQTVALELLRRAGRPPPT